MANDTKNSTISLSIWEAELFRMVLRLPGAANPPADDKPENRVPVNYIRDKWVYVFWSKGQEYGIPKECGPRSSSVWGRQHMAPRGKDQDLPEATQDKAEHVWRELYYNADGKLRWLDIGPSPYGGDPGFWKKSRWDSARVMPNKPGPNDDDAVQTIDIPLVDGNGEKIRYYFLISPVRLGPKALEEATKAGGADALSIWLREDGSNLAPDMSDFPEGQRSAWVFAVDPYATADHIHSWYRMFLGQHANMLDAMSHGNDSYLGGFVPTAKIDTDVPGGTPFDAYFIAKTLKKVKPTIDDDDVKDCPWNAALVDKVILEVERELKAHNRTVEVEALFHCNWLRSPAHRLIDIAVSEDTSGAPDSRIDEAAQDRAYGLVHWHVLTSELGLTAVGAAFLARNSEITPDSPVWKVLLKYTGTRLTEELDRQSFRYAGTILPDLVLRFVLLNIVGGVNVAQRVADVREVMNNTTYLPETVQGMTKPQKMPKEFTYKGDLEKLIGAGMFIAKTGTVQPGSILDDLTNPKWKGTVWNKHLDKLVDLADSTSIGKRLLKVYDVSNKYDLKGRLGTMAFFVSTVNLLATYADAASKIGSERTSQADKRKELAGAAIDTLKLGQEALELAGVEPMTWKEIAGTRRAQGLRAVVSGRALVTVIGTVAAIWQVYTGYKDMEKGWQHADYSVAAGGALVVMGGAVALAACFVEIPFAGWIAAGLTLIGGLIVAFTADHPLETFIRHCMFASSSDSPNIRPFGGNDHWAGPTRRGSRSWPVMHQRWALQNLYAPFKIKSHMSVNPEGRQWNHSPRSTDFVRLDCSMGYIPPLAHLRVKLLQKGTKSALQEFDFNFDESSIQNLKYEDRPTTTIRTGSRQEIIRMTVRLPGGQSTEGLDADVALIRSSEGEVYCKHTIGEMLKLDSPNMGPRSTFNVNADESAANKYNFKRLPTR